MPNCHAVSELPFALRLHRIANNRDVGNRIDQFLAAFFDDLTEIRFVVRGIILTVKLRRTMADGHFRYVPFGQSALEARAPFAAQHLTQVRTQHILVEMQDCHIEISRIDLTGSAKSGICW